MKLEFESNLEYQKTAISAVIELFKGHNLSIQHGLTYIQMEIMIQLLR